MCYCWVNLLGCYTVITSPSCNLTYKLICIYFGKCTCIPRQGHWNQHHWWWLRLMTTKWFSWSQPLQGLILHQAPWSLLSAVFKCWTKIWLFQLFPWCRTTSEFPFLTEDSPPLRSSVAKILNTSSACQSQTIPAGYAESQKKTRWSILDLFAWFHLTQIIWPSQDVYFVFSQQNAFVQDFRWHGNSWKGKNRLCRDVSFVLCPSKGLNTRKKP